MPKYFIKPDIFITIESETNLSQAEATLEARHFYEHEVVPVLKKFFKEGNKLTFSERRRVRKEGLDIKFNFCTLLEMMKFRGQK